MKLCINPSPTFEANVHMAVPGGQVAVLRLRFKHKTREELKAWMARFDGEAKDHELLDEVIADWPGGPVNSDDSPIPYSAAELARLCSQYPGSALAIHQTYISELTDARVKNSGR
jgi:hypothetical protein